MIINTYPELCVKKFAYQRYPQSYQWPIRKLISLPFKWDRPASQLLLRIQVKISLRIFFQFFWRVATWDFSKISGLHTLSEMQKLRIQSFDGKKPSVSDNYG